MKLVATTKSEQNEAMIDPWTIVHIGAGLAAGLIGMRVAPAATLAIGYEFFEQAFERSEMGQKAFKTSGPEHAANAALDVVVFMGAWYLGRQWNETS